MNFIKALDKYLDLREEYHAQRQFHGTYFKFIDANIEEKLFIAKEELILEVEKLTMIDSLCEKRVINLK